MQLARRRARLPTASLTARWGRRLPRRRPAALHTPAPRSSSGAWWSAPAGGGGGRGVLAWLHRVPHPPPPPTHTHTPAGRLAHHDEDGHAEQAEHVGANVFLDGRHVPHAAAGLQEIGRSGAAGLKRGGTHAACARVQWQSTPASWPRIGQREACARSVTPRSALQALPLVGGPEGRSATPTAIQSASSTIRARCRGPSAPPAGRHHGQWRCRPHERRPCSDQRMPGIC